MSGMDWDPLQREVLQALGHTLYRIAPAERPAIPNDVLLHALLRAAGRDQDAADALQLCRAWPAPPSLRGNAAAKRALWPQLRALRRTLS